MTNQMFVDIFSECVCSVLWSVRTARAPLSIQLRWWCFDCEDYPPSRDVMLRDSIGGAVWCGTGWMEASSPDVRGLWGNLARARIAAKVPADSLYGAEFCWWRAMWRPSQLVAEIKRLSSLGSLESGPFGVCCSFEKVLKIIWDEKRSTIERGNVAPVAGPTERTEGETISRSRTVQTAKKQRKLLNLCNNPGYQVLLPAEENDLFIILSHAQVSGLSRTQLQMKMIYIHHILPVPIFKLLVVLPTVQTPASDG